MKIRNGFVSNSSSSSFVIVGEKVNLNRIDPKSIKNSEQFMFESTSEGGEATVYGYISNPEMLEVLKKHPDMVRDVYEVFDFEYDADGIDISTVKIPRGRKAKIYTGVMEQHQISTIDELKECFPDAFEEPEPEDEDEGTNTFKVMRRVYMERISGNHDEFYEMTDLGNGKFQARYGKRGTPGTIKEYETSRWDEKYNEKMKKGYYKR